MFLEVALVFALIGLLGLVLRWTFSRDSRAPRWPAESANHTPVPTWPAASGGLAGPVGRAVSAGSTAEASTVPATSDDYGLLASVAAVDSQDEAKRIQTVLYGAGIRATTTVSANGQHRVLVFASEIHRARRVAGGS